MAFSLFGKRDKTPDASEPISIFGSNQPTPEPEPEETSEKRGFFNRMRSAVARTRTAGVSCHGLACVQAAASEPVGER